MEGVNNSKQILGLAGESLLANAEYEYAIGSHDKALELAAICYLLTPNSKILDLLDRCNKRINVHKPVVINPPTEVRAEAPVTIETLSEEDIMAKRILQADDLFDMIGRTPWDPIPDIEKAFKKTIFSVHSDRNSSSLSSNASSKLTDEIKKFRSAPSAYTKKIEQERANRGIRDSGIDPLFDRDNYGKQELKMGPDGQPLKEELNPMSGFDRDGKRSYTWFAQAGPKRHVDCNPEVGIGKDAEVKTTGSLYADPRGETAWMGLLEFSDATAHKFSNKGKYESFSQRGVSSSKHGTKFLAKNK